MAQNLDIAESSPLLGHCPDSLPSGYYFDHAHFEKEQKKIWARNWVYAGRVIDHPAMTVRRISVAGQNLVLVKDQSGEFSCFHNTCRHRGAEFCQAQETALKSKLISCPYHGWSYDFQGHLVRTPFVSASPDFKKEEHGLFRVHTRIWNGFIFVCLAEEAPDFDLAPDMGPAALDNWPMDELATGHTMVKEIACNWKIFWENYNECLHCPGIHPELCDRVPIYGRGYMAPNESPDWTPDLHSGSTLSAGARTWTVNGQACGQEFPRLTPQQRNAGHYFVTLFPTTYIVAHVDYVRVGSLRPLGPERTELRTEWLFPADTLAAPGFDLDNVTKFASTVISQDSNACEMNQRGLRSSKFEHGRLMPQEFDVHRFQQWVRQQLIS